MSPVLERRLAALLSVKSLVTLIATFVFAWQELHGGVSQEFMVVYTIIIGFYFGTQSQKVQEILDEEVRKHNA